jgi:hypothetical protein
MNENGAYVGDVMSIGIIASTLAGWLPTIAAVLSIVWVLIRIWETDTVKSWTNRGPKV